jgi:hypothetical protein
MAYCAVDQQLLAVRNFVGGAVRGSHITAVRLHVARLYGVGQVDGENLVVEMAD